jgi:hypothetical protein
VDTIPQQAASPSGLSRQTGLIARLSKVDQTVYVSPKDQLLVDTGWMV